MTGFKFDRNTHGRFHQDSDKWEIRDDCGFNPILTNVADLELVTPRERRGAKVNFGRRQVALASMPKAGVQGVNWGQLHAEWMLEREADIPPEWEMSILLFPGTTWKNVGVSGVVNGPVEFPALSKHGGRWHLHFMPQSMRYPSARYLRLRQQ